MEATFLCYPKCNSCKKAEKWLKENAIAYSFRPIKEANPTKEELTLWIKISGLSISRFFNTSGVLYKEQNLKNKIKLLTDNELIELLASNGLLVKRPLLVTKHLVLVGFKEHEWTAGLK